MSYPTKCQTRAAKSDLRTTARYYKGVCRGHQPPLHSRNTEVTTSLTACLGLLRSSMIMIIYDRRAAFLHSTGYGTQVNICFDLAQTLSCKTINSANFANPLNVPNQSVCWIYMNIYIYTHTIFDRFIQVHTDSCFCRILQKDTEGARSKETESKPRILAEFIQRPSSASVGGIDMNPQIFLLARHCDTNLVQEGSSLGAVCGTSESVCWSFNKMIPLSSVAQSNQVSRMMNPECPWHFSWMSFAKSLKAAISSVPGCRNFSGSRWFKSVPAWNCPRTCLHCLCFMDLYGALLVLLWFLSNIE